ncbi:hypothetical protein MSG28_001366 [Choristoneura fumiferana]|uniref:Uncharacterized protein n=1 Tax=Choristoneura fumiferana TaxID=7141 RepID=A0ACC0KUD4_CHOFU|nr:hypothetical protein MSG28_001366 [Choristoneura fumiferana]
MYASKYEVPIKQEVDEKPKPKKRAAKATTSRAKKPKVEPESSKKHLILTLKNFERFMIRSLPCNPKNYILQTLQTSSFPLLQRSGALQLALARPHHAHGLSLPNRGKRLTGIVNECCDKPCNIDEMLTFEPAFLGQVLSRVSVPYLLMLGAMKRCNREIGYVEVALRDSGRRYCHHGTDCTHATLSGRRVDVNKRLAFEKRSCVATRYVDAMRALRRDRCRERILMAMAPVLELSLNSEVIQVYAPTSSHSDDEISEFYDDISTALRENPTFYTTVIGDFNAKLGKPRENEEFVGRFGLGERNSRGHDLASYLCQQKLFAMNTFFQKKPQKMWTWRSPDGKTKNQIDYILSSKRYIFEDVGVINMVGAGSDHRIVRARLALNLKLELRRLVESNRPSEDRKYIEVQREYYQRKLSEKLTAEDAWDIDAINDQLVCSINETLDEIRPKSKLAQEPKSKELAALLEERQKILATSSQTGISVVNKKIRHLLRKHLRQKKHKLILETIEKHRGPKVFRKQLKRGGQQIHKLTTEEGSITTDRTKILELVEDYYADYKDRKEHEFMTNETYESRKKENRHVSAYDEWLAPPPAALSRLSSFFDLVKKTASSGLSMKRQQVEDRVFV